MRYRFPTCSSRLFWRSFLAIAVFGVAFTFGSQHPAWSQMAHQATTGYIAPNAVNYFQKRALLLPVGNETKQRGCAETFHDQLETAIRSASVFQIVDCPTTSCRALRPLDLCNGVVPMKTLADLRRQFNAELLIIASITEYNPYQHPKIGVDLRIVETANAEVIASFSGTWDSRDKQIANRATQFYQTRTRGGALCSEHMTFLAPRFFSEFVAHDLASQLSNWAHPVLETTPPQMVDAPTRMSPITWLQRLNFRR